jgi:hypothetical protein
MNFYIFFPPRSKQERRKKKYTGSRSIISIEETHPLYKSEARKSAAHYCADLREATSVGLIGSK